MSYPPVPAYNDQTQSQSAQPYPFQSHQQPPLRPTGFIQGQHGMLIPVYQPEALHQYMSSTDQTQPTSQGPAPPPHTSTWPQHAQYPFAPYHVPMQHTGPRSSQHSQSYSQKAWVHTPHDLSAYNGPPYHHGPLLLPPSASMSSMPSFDGTNPVPFPGNMRHVHRNGGISSPRRSHRRDHAHASPFPNQRA